MKNTVLWMCALVALFLRCGGGFKSDSNGAGPLREWATEDSIASANAEAAFFTDP